MGSSSSESSTLPGAYINNRVKNINTTLLAGLLITGSSSDSLASEELLEF